MEGDLGTVAAKARATQKTMFASKPLTVQAVLKCACVAGTLLRLLSLSYLSWEAWQFVHRVALT